MGQYGSAVERRERSGVYGVDHQRHSKAVRERQVGFDDDDVVRSADLLERAGDRVARSRGAAVRGRARRGNVRRVEQQAGAELQRLVQHGLVLDVEAHEARDAAQPRVLPQRGAVSRVVRALDDWTALAVVAQQRAVGISRESSDKVELRRW